MSNESLDSVLWVTHLGKKGTRKSEKEEMSMKTVIFCLMILLFLGFPISGKTKSILPPMMVKTSGMGTAIPTATTTAIKMMVETKGMIPWLECQEMRADCF